jgi:hypothetical protein
MIWQRGIIESLLKFHAFVLSTFLNGEFTNSLCRIKLNKCKIKNLNKVYILSEPVGGQDTMIKKHHLLVLPSHL